MKGFEENEISEKAQGGTEIAKRKLAAILPEELLENFQIVCSRPRELEEDKIRVFWCHDLPEDPESNKFRDQEFKDSFHKYVFVSNWQYQRYQLIHGIPYDDKSIVLEHGIETAPEDVIDKKPKDGKIRLCYTSTPQRGLDILVPVFMKLAETNPDIHLDVFKKFYDNIPPDLKIQNNVGMHVHISRKPLSQLTIGKMTEFLNRDDNKEFIHHIAGRINNSYARMDKSRSLTFPWKYKQGGNVNVNPGNTYFDINTPLWGMNVTSISISHTAFIPNANLGAYLDTLTIGTVFKIFKIIFSFFNAVHCFYIWIISDFII